MAARQKKVSTPTGKSVFSTKGKVVCIFGESPLVEEYAARCLSKGFQVHVRLNGSSQRRKRSRGNTTHLPTGAKLVTKASAETYCALELTNTSVEAKKKNLLDFEKTLRPSTIIITSSTTITVTEQCTWVSAPGRLIGLGALPSLLQGSLLEFAPSPMSDESTITAAKEFAGALDKEPAIVQDSVGLVLPRIICMLANEACFAMMEGVAQGTDIDTAMKLGTNYPYGPLEWAERIGLRQVHAVITSLHRSYGEERYRVAPLLARAALSTHSQVDSVLR